jgi:hypothetical protein
MNDGTGLSVGSLMIRQDAKLTGPLDTAFGTWVTAETVPARHPGKVTLTVVDPLVAPGWIGIAN